MRSAAPSSGNVNRLSPRLIAGLALASALCSTGCSRPVDAADAAPAPAALEVRPLASVEAYRKVIDELRGKTVVVNFWATWCGPCVAEFPELIELRDHYADRDVVLVTVSVDFDTDLETKVKPFLTKHKVTEHAYLQDAADANAFINGIHEPWDGELPASFIYDAEGELKQFLPGQQSYDEFEQALLAVLPAE